MKYYEILNEILYEILYEILCITMKYYEIIWKKILWNTMQFLNHFAKLIILN